MKYLFLSFFALFAFQSYSQAPEIKPPVKYLIGFTFSPDYAYRAMSSDPAMQWIAHIRNDREIPKFGFTTGPRILFVLGNRVSLESGLLFADKGEKTKKIYYTSLQPDPDPNMPEYGEHNHHYYYLDLPAKVNYYLTSNKLKLFVSAGTSANFLLKGKTNSKLTYSNGRTEKQKSSDGFGFHAVNFSALAGIGVDYSINENLSLRIEPIYRRSVVSITSTPVQSHLYSFGTNLGLFLAL